MEYVKRLLHFILHGGRVPAAAAAHACRKILAISVPSAIVLMLVLFIFRRTLLGLAAGWIAVPFLLISSFAVGIYFGELVTLRERRNWKPFVSTARATFIGRSTIALGIFVVFNFYIDYLLQL